MMTKAVVPAPQSRRRGLVRSPQDLAAGLFLLALALFGAIGSANLSFGKLATIGPGLMPRSVALLVAAFGLLLIVQAVTALGARLEAWSLRGMIFVLGAVVMFAATIRPVGLAISGPLAILLSAMAERSTRPLEIIVFAVVMTAFCIGLFKFLLRLPIPVLPLVLGY